MHALIILVWTEPLARIQELVIYVYAHNSIQELTARHVKISQTSNRNPPNKKKNFSKKIQTHVQLTLA
jgi:hypothetical protein